MSFYLGHWQVQKQGDLVYIRKVAAGYMVTCYLSEHCPTVWQSLEFICPMDYTVKVNYNSDQEEFKV